MVDEASVAGASSSHVTGECSESTIEINIKTLDSKIYTFQVNKEMQVSALKAKLVDVTGVPVERQRLIFRGKVLKDDHLLSEYYLEDGHTLHLVARQPVQEQPSSGTVAEGMTQDSNGQGNDSTSGASPSRIGQVSHGILLGTVNVADQGESMVADIGRLVGAVLSSLGVGTPIPNGAASNTSPSSAPNQVPLSGEAERNPNASGRSVSGNPAAPSFTVLNHPFQTVHQIPQFPPNGFPSQNMTIPDSLTTLSEFISRMELVLQNGSNSSSSNVHNPPGPENPSLNARGLPTPELLCTVLEQAQQLLRGNASTQLSNIASRLERDGTSTDLMVRGQTQAEAVHVGVAMQHLGAMLLELGRTMMTLRMGQSPTDSSVNAGPAVYISSAGPNPIMVQPFPLQTNSLFGVSTSPLFSGVSGQFTSGDPSRNINIHIHAGSRVTPGASTATSRGGSVEAMHGESSNSEPSRGDNNNTPGSVPTHGLPPRAVVAAIPARATAQTAGHVLNVIYPVHVRSQLSVPIHSAAPQVPHPAIGSWPQPNTTAIPPDTIPTLVAQISTQVANALAGSIQGLSSESQNMQSANIQGSHVQTARASQTDQTHSESSSLSGTMGTLVAQMSSQVANALAGSVQGLGSETQNVQSANIQGSQVQTARASQGDQTHSESSAISSNAQGQSSSPNLQCTDWSGVEGNVNVGDDENTSFDVPRIPESEGNQPHQESSYDTNNCRSSGVSSTDEDSTTTNSTLNQFNDTVSSVTSHGKNSASALPTHAAQSSQGGNSDRPTPLGLGLGGLQQKRRGKKSKPEEDKPLQETPPVNQNQQSVAMGQQFLQSLVSQSSDVDRANSNGSSNPPSLGQIMDGFPSGRQGNIGQDGQVDAAGMMSHILRSPAFNNLLSGVASQTGIGSSSDLRTMLEQCTQSPAVRNTLNEIAQQVEGQSSNLGAIFSGSGRGQGGLDFSRMIQQMLPVVSQALGRDPTRTTSANGMQLDNETPRDEGFSQNDMLRERNSEVDLELAVERIEQHDTPGNVFRFLLESTGHLVGESNGFRDLADELSNNEELITDFTNMLLRDLNSRMQSDSASER